MPNRRMPNNVHKLNGTYRDDRHGKDDPNTPVANIKSGYPSPPKYLKALPDAYEIWAEVKRVMGKATIYTKADAAKLARYCVLEAEFRTSLCEFPSTKLAQLRLMEKDLYLDPEARAKIGASSKKKENPFDDF